MRAKEIIEILSLHPEAEVICSHWVYNPNGADYEEEIEILSVIPTAPKEDKSEIVFHLS